MKKLPADHELRYELNEELHNHPYEPLSPPERIILFVMLVTPEERNQEEGHLGLLVANHSAASIETSPNRIRYDFGAFRLKIERHIEFTRYKFVWSAQEELSKNPFIGSLDSLLPQDWLSQIPGRLVNAINVSLLKYPDDESISTILERYSKFFNFNRLVASNVGRSENLVMTDFEIKEVGMIPMLVFTRALRPAQNGRLILRLLEMDSYRSLAMLSVPAARNILRALPNLEGELASLTEAVASGDGNNDESLLERLTSIAARVERMTAANFKLLSASIAYFNLVSQRLSELHEISISQINSIGGVIERRLEPARRSCEAATERLEQLSNRISNTSQLLITRIDVRREMQNQQLLVSMNDRFKSQLRLQEAAELLSFVIVPYYGVNLLAYIFEEIDDLTGLNFNPIMLKALGVPVFILILLVMLRWFHRLPK